MRKLVFLIVVLHIIGSCSVDEYNPVLPEKNEIVGGKRHVTLEEVVYHAGTESFLLQQNDPYSLHNFKKALSNLATGNTDQALTKSQTVDFQSVQELSATHYALRMYPRNEHEQWQIERMDDIGISYIPFDYVQLPDDDQTRLKLEAGNELSQGEELEESSYIVVYDDLETIDSLLPSETYTMPILYVVWPCEKPFPEGYDYKIDYEVFIPEYYDGNTKSQFGLSMDELWLLENEAVSIALGQQVNEDTKALTPVTYVRVLRGSIYHADKLMDKLPLENLKLQFRLGSNIQETYTGSNGFFNITATIPDEASFIAVYNHAKWKITSENSTSPITFNFGTVQDVWKDGNDIYRQVISGSPYMEIHRAVNYYYNGSHSVRTWHYDDGIRIRALSREGEKELGYFSYSLTGPASITIFGNTIYDQNITIGTVLHELGHFTHYGERGGYRMFKKVHTMIKESFASYVGFYLGEKYYISHGFVKPSVNYYITRQGRQNWQKTDNQYTPLFVDLIDDYNQGNASNSYPYDRITNVPHSLMREIAQEDYDWNECRSRLVRNIGRYYTETEFNAFISDFDYWFQNN